MVICDVFAVAQHPVVRATLASLQQHALDSWGDGKDVTTVHDRPRTAVQMHATAYDARLYETLCAGDSQRRTWKGVETSGLYTGAAGNCGTGGGTVSPAEGGNCLGPIVAGMGSRGHFFLHPLRRV